MGITPTNSTSGSGYVTSSETPSNSATPSRRTSLANVDNVRNVLIEVNAKLEAHQKKSTLGGKVESFFRTLGKAFESLGKGVIACLNDPGIGEMSEDIQDTVRKNKNQKENAQKMPNNFVDNGTYNKSSAPMKESAAYEGKRGIGQRVKAFVPQDDAISEYLALHGSKG